MTVLSLSILHALITLGNSTKCLGKMAFASCFRA
jgi:hypothetical protein